MNGLENKINKIFISTSWKNETQAIHLANALRDKGYEVDCFCDSSTGRFVFSYNELINYESMDCIEFIKTKQATKAFNEDKKYIEWCDLLIMVLPCGKSAHLEAGYAKGIGKKVFMLGSFPSGEFDVMYKFANKLIRWGGLTFMYDLLKYIRKEGN